MEDLLEVARKRSAPGVLILDLDGRLRYLNARARELVPTLDPDSIGSTGTKSGIPSEVVELCRRVQADHQEAAEPESVVMFETMPGLGCAARAILVGSPGSRSHDSHVLVLLEPVVWKRDADWAEARKRYDLTTREVDIVKCVWEGLANKEIAGKLFISEHTVKDHIKNIMRKMSVDSRAEMAAKVR
jgi:DNA-binding CsgD family transcriptional regulator